MGQLNNLPLILPISTKQDRISFEEFLNKHNIEKWLSLEVTNYDSGKDYAMSGLGFALLPKHYVENTDLAYMDIDLEKKYYDFIY